MVSRTNLWTNIQVVLRQSTSLHDRSLDEVQSSVHMARSIRMWLYMPIHAHLPILALLDDLVSVTFIPIHGLVRSRQSQIERWWSREWKQTLLHKSLFFLLCRPWGNVEELEWREIKSVLLDDNFFRAWVVATQVNFFSPHSDADGSVEVLCLILWGDLCNKKFLHTSFHGLKVRQMFAVCMFSCAFGGVFLPKKNLWRIYSLTKIHYKHELFCTCVRNSDLLSQDIYTRVLLLMYAKKILQFLTNSGIIAWGWICVPSCHRRRNTLRRKWFAAQLRRFLSSKIRCSVDHPRRFSS